MYQDPWQEITGSVHRRYVFLKLKLIICFLAIFGILFFTKFRYHAGGSKYGVRFIKLSICVAKTRVNYNLKKVSRALSNEFANSDEPALFCILVRHIFFGRASKISSAFLCLNLHILSLMWTSRIEACNQNQFT